jgi:hypothetical protein
MYSDVTAPGRELHQRFVSLGDMTGKTVDEIISVVGQPSSYSSMAGGQMLVQWQATGCHLALLFGRDGKMVRITHQYAKYAPTPAGCLTMSIALTMLLILVTAAAVALEH